MPMTTSAQGRAKISSREGFRLKAYQDSVDVWTIGVGHTGRASPPNVTEGMTVTPAQVDAMLASDLVQFERAITNAVHVSLSQNEFDALVSLAFNIGASAFAGSSVARRLNEGNKPSAADAFLMWNKAGGKVLAGLETRREDERKQFLTPYSSSQTMQATVTYQQPAAPNPREPAVAHPGFWASLFAAFKGKPAA